MPIATVVAQIVVAGVLALLVEGANIASGGEVYLDMAHRQWLAQQVDVQPVTVEQPPAGGEAPPQPVQPPFQQEGQPPEKSQPFFGDEKDRSEEEGSEEEDFRDFVDPREISDALRQLKDLSREVIRLGKTLKRIAGGEVYRSKLDELAAEISRHREAISSPNVDRETLQDFYDAQLWDTLNEVRIAAEFPKQYQEMSRTFRNLERMLKVKSMILMARNLGLNLDVFRQEIAVMKQALATAKSEYDSGNLEEVQQLMQENFYDEGKHPGNLEGLLHRFKNIDDRTRSIRNSDLRNQIFGMLREVVETANQGDFQDANEIFNDIEPKIMGEINKILRSTKSTRPRR